ncbi:hypothetical protein ES708_31552 [subsurface metagenome]
MSYSRNVKYHLGKSRSILSPYKNPAAKITAREFKALERKVKKNEQEVHVLRENDNVKSQTGTGWEQTTVDISSAIKSSGLFREHILGDKYRVKGFKLKMWSQCEFVRIILYRHKRTAGSLSLTGFSHPNAAIYDPSPLKAVYFDKTYTRKIENTSVTPDGQWVCDMSKSLNFMNVINSDNSDLQETPPLNLLIIAKGSTGDDTIYSWEVAYQNI